MEVPPERRKPGKRSTRLKRLLEAMREDGAFDSFGNRIRTIIIDGNDVTERVNGLLTDVRFLEMEPEEILEIRHLQKEKFIVDEEKLYDDIFELQGSSGLGFLGRDRAYRNYWSSGALSAVLVEDSDWEIGECEEATPLTKVFRKDAEDVPIEGDYDEGNSTA